MRGESQVADLDKERVARMRYDSFWWRMSGAAPGFNADTARRLWPFYAHVITWGTVAVAVGLVTWIVVVTGGAPNALMHLYYLPILYAAARYNRLGALIAGVATGLAAGPWMPSSATEGANQATRDWLVRMAIFILVGVVAAWLARQQPRPLGSMLRDVVVGQALRAAVRNRRLSLHFQPIIDLTTGRVDGVEALCRWSDAGGRPVPPSDFIPIAERTGAIVGVGREVLRMATEQRKAWCAEGIVCTTMSVNVSGVQLSDPGFLAELDAVRASCGEGPFNICLEITETAVMADSKRAFETLKAARAMGATIALDDFGTGYSALEYLAEYPIDLIKIDRSFVSAVANDARSQALVSAAVHLAEALGAQTVAEGIETPEQLAMLRRLGVNFGQGYLLGRPGESDCVDWSRRVFHKGTVSLSA